MSGSSEQTLLEIATAKRALEENTLSDLAACAPRITLELETMYELIPILASQNRINELQQALEWISLCSVQHLDFFLCVDIQKHWLTSFNTILCIKCYLRETHSIEASPVAQRHVPSMNVGDLLYFIGKALRCSWCDKRLIEVNLPAKCKQRDPEVHVVRNYIPLGRILGLE